MNELILGLRIALDLGAVLIAYYIGREWLYGAIVVNLLLVSIVGAKLVPVLGFFTNDTNVFYAAVLFATILLLEHGSWSDGERSIGVGIWSIFLYQVLLQLSLHLAPFPGTEEFSSLTAMIIGASLRTAVASLFSFIVAQHVVIWLYAFWHEEVGHVHWWLRLASVVLVTQLIDSIIFFFIAFWGVLEPRLVFEAVTTGYVIRLAIGLVMLPLVYLSFRLNDSTSRE